MLEFFLKKTKQKKAVSIMESSAQALVPQPVNRKQFFEQLLRLFMQVKKFCDVQSKFVEFITETPKKQHQLFYSHSSKPFLFSLSTSYLFWRTSKRPTHLLHWDRCCCQLFPKSQGSHSTEACRCSPKFFASKLIRTCWVFLKTFSESFLYLSSSCWL